MKLYVIFTTLSVFLSPPAQAVIHSDPYQLPELLDADSLDKSIAPCTDFYQYACGGWTAKFKIPADKTKFWHPATPLNEKTDRDLNKMLAGFAKTSPEKQSEKATLLGTFYKSCLNEYKNQKTSEKIIVEQIKKIESVADKKAFANMVAEIHLQASNPFFSFYSDASFSDATKMTAYIDRGGLNLGPADDYLATDEKALDVQTHYKAYAQNLMNPLTTKAFIPTKTGDLVFGLEHRLAEKALLFAETRDITKQVHPMTREQLKALVPSFDWDEYFTAMGTPLLQEMNVNEPELMKRLNEVFKSNSLVNLKRYLIYSFVDSVASSAGGIFETQHFNFWNKFKQGQKERPPRWKFCAQKAKEKLADTLSDLYLNTIPDRLEIQENTNKMITLIKDAFQEDLDTLTWMDAPTRRAAFKKLQKMDSIVGWPDHWEDNSGAVVSQSSLVQNVSSISALAVKRNLSKIGKPVDRGLMGAGAWEANAWYSSSKNQITLPLGELVPPIYDLKYSDGPNYGSLGGGTIGHELTHGFDDSGKDFDADGNVKLWWSDEVKKKFDEKSQCFIQQAEQYVVKDSEGIFMNGKAVLGENLADNGGVKLGLMALKKNLKNPIKDSARVAKLKTGNFHNLNEIQLYFLGYAQSWCTAIRPERLKNDLKQDYHPPAEFRVNGVLMNHPEFADAFGCKAGSRMAPPIRCSVW